MRSIETEGDSVDAAVEIALRELGATRDDVEIEILEGGARGLLGFGSRKARIRATLRAGDRPVPAPAETPIPAQPAPATDVAGREPDATATRAREVLEQIVRLVGVEADVEMRHEDDQIVLDLTGDDSGILIGRRGQMLDALEYVLNRILLKDQSEAARVIVDSQGYRARREASLREMAHRMAEQAKERQRPVTLNPMSPRDRRIVHLALSDTGVTTRSSGDGYLRNLVIIPAGTRRSRPR